MTFEKPLRVISTKIVFDYTYFTYLLLAEINIKSLLP